MDKQHHTDIPLSSSSGSYHKSVTNALHRRFTLGLAASLAAFVLLSPMKQAVASSSTVSTLPSGIVPATNKGQQSTPQAQATDALNLRILPGATSQSLFVELTNEGDSTLHILRDGTPFDDVPGGDVLRIMPSGKQGIHALSVPYSGPVYGRLPADSSRFIAIEPAQSISVEFDITSNYAIAADGDYRIQFVGNFEVASGVTQRSAVNLPDIATSWAPNVDAIELTLPATPLIIQSRAQPPQFTSCSAAQQSSINAATVSGETIANESLQSLNATPVESRPTSPRYTTWFGRYSESNYSTVTAVFNRMSSVLTNETIAYRCEPEFCDTNSNIIAFVQPFRSNLVNICGLFFNEQRLDDEDRAGTVVHELSHLRSIGATNDLSYGPSGTAAVARASANDALNNAESYTLFAKNNQPSLPMIGDSTTGGGQVAEVPDEVDTTLDINPLEGGVTARNTLAMDDIDVFRVTDATALELTSVSGDADLYVFNNANLAREALVCSSFEDSRDTALDTCQLVGNSDTFAVVHAFNNTTYALVAVPEVSDDTAIDPAAILLAVGESDTGVLQERDAVLYSAVMPAQIVLTSLTGDSDLYVFSNSSLATESLVCSSFLVTPQDQCQLPGSGRVHIGVLGFGAENNYEISIRALNGETTLPPGPDVPAEDDPTPFSLNTSSGGGGGASGFTALLVLFGFALYRCCTLTLRKQSTRLTTSLT